MDVVFSVCIVRRASCRCSCMGSVSVSSCRCCMCVSCVHPVAVLHAELCIHNYHYLSTLTATLYYYRFIGRFPIGLDFLFITFLLHFIISWTSSFSISSSATPASTLSNHVLLGRMPSTLNSIHFFTQSSSLFLITYQYHLILPLLMTLVIGSTPTSLLNSTLVRLSLMETPHIHLIIYIICQDG